MKSEAKIENTSRTAKNKIALVNIISDIYDPWMFVEGIASCMY